MKLGRIPKSGFSKSVDIDKIPEKVAELLPYIVFVKGPHAFCTGFALGETIITAQSAFRQKGGFSNIEVGYNLKNFIPLPEGVQEKHPGIFMAAAGSDDYSITAESLLIKVIVVSPEDKILFEHINKKLPIQEFEEKDEPLDQGKDYFVVCHHNGGQVENHWNVFKVKIDGFEDPGTKCYADEHASHLTGIIGGIVLSGEGKMVGVVIGHDYLGPEKNQSTYLVMPILHVRKFFVDKKNQTKKTRQFLGEKILLNK